MNKIVIFRSTLAEQMQQFVAFKRMQGYDYSSQARKLSYFDRFLFEKSDNRQAQPLSLKVLQDYVATTAHLEKYSRRTRLSSLREFTLYLHARNPGSAVLPKDIVPPCKPVVRFYRFNPEQVADIIRAVASVLPPERISTQAIRVLIGILYCTGLRVGEALNLTLGDIDVQRSMLHVAKGKFGKQRLVPIAPLTLTALRNYLNVRRFHASTASNAALFIGDYDKPLSHQQAYRGFIRLTRYCGFCDRPPPRLHDLRHNYACHRLALWRKEGRDIHAMLPVLAVAMGHLNIVHTQVYLHVGLEDLHHAATLLNTHLNTHSETLK